MAVRIPWHIRRTISEATPDFPCSVYDSHKLAAESLLAMLPDVCVLRMSNVYGPGRPTNAERGIVNQMIRRAMLAQPLTLYGEGQWIRDFLYIEYAIAAFVRAIEDRPRGKFVVSSGVGRTMLGAFRAIQNQAAETSLALNPRIVLVPIPNDLHPIETRSAWADPAKFMQATGWHPKTEFREGIARTMEQAAVS